MAVTLTVIGLHQIGASIGMALEIHKEKITRTGHDPAPHLAQNLLKKKAFDRISANLHDAVRDAQIVVLAVPADQVETTLKQIAPDLKPGTIVIDTSPNRRQAAQWAQQYLRPEDHFISMTPVINPAYLDVLRPQGIWQSPAAGGPYAIPQSRPSGFPPDARRYALPAQALQGSRRPIRTEHGRVPTARPS